MPDLIRPEARILFHRWSEVLATLALTALGLWWALATPGPAGWLGWLAAALGAALVVGALQRLRFASPGTAEGIVELDEGEIRYLGPRGGGIVALDAILVLSLSADARFWLIESHGGAILAIPRKAPGAEALFDAFATLPGLNMALLLRRLDEGPAARIRPIWRRPLPAPLT